MAMTLKTVQRVGNSSGVILSPEVLQAAGLQRGDSVSIRVERGTIIIAPVEMVRDEVMEAGQRFIAKHADALRRLAE